jgi:hypothetical protein
MAYIAIKHLPLQTSKVYNNKPWKTSFFRVDVELDTRPWGKQHTIVCVCLWVSEWASERACEAMLERKRLNPRGRKEEDTGGERISRVTRPMTCLSTLGQYDNTCGRNYKIKQNFNENT